MTLRIEKIWHHPVSAREGLPNPTIQHYYELTLSHIVYVIVIIKDILAVQHNTNVYIKIFKLT